MLDGQRRGAGPSHPIRHVRRRILGQERLARWVAKVNGDLQLGGAFWAIFTSGWEGPGRVEVCEPPRRLLVTLSPGQEDQTVIDVELIPDGELIRLVLEERGLPLDGVAGHGAGWQAHLEDLSAHLAGRPSADWRTRWAELTPVYAEQERHWPDRLDVTTGDFAYFGDNRRPGSQLLQTQRRGNLLLQNSFAHANGERADRRLVPPYLLFQRSSAGRDVVFRGLLAPGSPRLSPEEELVAVWRTTAGSCSGRRRKWRSPVGQLAVAAWTAKCTASRSSGRSRSASNSRRIRDSRCSTVFRCRPSTAAVMVVLDSLSR